MENLASHAAPMPWPVEQVLARFAGPSGYVLSQARAEDAPELARSLRAWYPDIEVGAESPHLEEGFYAREVHLAGTDPERALLTLVARPQGSSALVAALTLQKNPLARSLTGRLGAVDPSHRAAALGMLGPRLLEAFGRGMAAGLVHYSATLKSRHQQVIAERLGYRAVGIVPAIDRDMIAPGCVRRVYEVQYAKVLAAPEQVHKPQREALTARTRALYDLLFEDDAS